MVTIWLVITVVFAIMRSAGDPAALLLPDTASPEQIQALREKLGLADPLFIQYVKYWRQVARGDFGESIRFSRPALKLVIDRFPATIELAIAAFILAAVFGVTIGTLAAYTRGSAFDRLSMALMSVLQSAPGFFLGILLILLFSVKLRWLPTSGYGSPAQIVLPAITLSAPTLANLARLSRSSFLEVLRADYIRTAQAKGLGRSAIWRRHALKNAALPILTIGGMQLAQLLTGAVLIETVFAWPGIGRLSIDSVTSRDYPVVQASVILISVIFIAINLVVDLAYQWIDPRISNV
jgi:ABC-type dipeptide/oligopeptide/nickel transport system permease component